MRSDGYISCPSLVKNFDSVFTNFHMILNLYILEHCVHFIAVPLITRSYWTSFGYFNSALYTEGLAHS